MKNITAGELSQWLGDPGRPRPVLLDVREPWEFGTCHIEGSKLVPMREIPQRAEEIGKPDEDLVVICHHGSRSMQVALFLERKGYAKVHNLAGGVDAWAKTVDPKMPKY